MPSRREDGVHGVLVGRERERKRLGRLVARERLVTVTGPAGVGKSRLAAAVVDAGEGHGDRRCDVRMAWGGEGGASGPAGPGHLAAAILEAVTGRGAPAADAGQGLRPGTDPGTGSEIGPGSRPGTGPGIVTAALVEALPRADFLLFLDDVDPWHAECVRLVQTLLAARPALRVLVTARRPLGLGDERVLRLGPLGWEPLRGRRPAPAVELFLDRARAAGRRAGAAAGATAGTAAGATAGAAAGIAAGASTGYTEFDARDLAAVRDICGALGGLPLAIELAAQQTARFRVAEVAAMLRDHQCWLRSSHLAVPRHRSLRDAVGSAYALADRGERTVWARASVLPGAFAEWTAELVCAGGSVAPADVPACLVRLAAVGVLDVVHEDRDGPAGDPGPWYRMSAPAREFGAERLRDAGEFEVAAERRALHCRQVATVAGNLWDAGSQQHALALVGQEAETLAAALRHAPDDPELVTLALETVLDLWFWWAVHDQGDEGLHHLFALLPLCDLRRPETARGLWLAAWLVACNDAEGATALLRHAWPTAVTAGDSATIGRIAHVHGVLSLARHDLAAAADHFAEAADTIPRGAPGGPPPAVSHAARAVTLASVAPAAARRAARRAAAQADLTTDAWACYLARYALAVVDHAGGRSTRAWRRTRRMLVALEGAVAGRRARAAVRRLADDIEAGRPPTAYGYPPASTAAGLPTGLADGRGSVACTRSPWG